VLLFRGIAKLDLVIVPTHRTGRAALASSSASPKPFAPVVLAVGAVIAARMAMMFSYHGVSVQSLRLPMISFVVAALAVVLSPLLVFAGPLLKAKSKRC